MKGGYRQFDLVLTLQCMFSTCARSYRAFARIIRSADGKHLQHLARSLSSSICLSYIEILVSLAGRRPQWPTPVAGLTGRLAVCFALLPSTCSCRRQRRRRAVVVGDMPPSRPSPRCRLSHAKRDSFRCLVSSSVVLLFEYFVVAWSTCRQLRSLRRRISAIASSAADHESASMILSAAGTLHSFPMTALCASPVHLLGRLREAAWWWLLRSSSH